MILHSNEVKSADIIYNFLFLLFSLGRKARSRLSVVCLAKPVGETLLTTANFQILA